MQHAPFHHDDLLKHLDRIHMHDWQRTDARMKMQQAGFFVDLLLDVLQSIRNGGRRLRYVTRVRLRPLRRRLAARY